VECAEVQRGRRSVRAYGKRPVGEEAPAVVAALALALGEGWEPVAALVLGHAADELPAGEKPRKRRQDVWEVRA